LNIWFRNAPGRLVEPLQILHWEGVDRQSCRLYRPCGQWMCVMHQHALLK